MQPDMSYQKPISPSPQQNPYDFLINGGQPEKKTPSQNAQSAKQRTIFMIIGVMMVVLAGLLIYSFTSKNTKADNQALIEIGAEQTEVIRVAGLADGRARSSGSKNLAINTSLVTKSDLKVITDIIKKRGATIPPKALDTRKSKKTDDKLVAADQNNEFDDVYNELMLKQLVSYQTKVRTAIQQAPSKKEKQILSDINNDIVLLVSTIPALAQ